MRLIGKPEPVDCLRLLPIQIPMFTMAYEFINSFCGIKNPKRWQLSSNYAAYYYVPIRCNKEKLKLLATGLRILNVTVLSGYYFDDSSQKGQSAIVGISYGNAYKIDVFIEVPESEYKRRKGCRSDI